MIIFRYSSPISQLFCSQTYCHKTEEETILSYWAILYNEHFIFWECLVRTISDLMSWPKGISRNTRNRISKQIIINLIILLELFVAIALLPQGQKYPPFPLPFWVLPSVKNFFLPPSLTIVNLRYSRNNVSVTCDSNVTQPLAWH